MSHATDLILFSQIVETGSFSQAARLAGLSPSAISKRLSKLEQELGVQLIYRTTRRLTLTEAGEELYRHSREIDGHVSDALAAVSGFSADLTGKLTLSVPTISGELLLSEAVAEFCQLHPKLSVELRLENQFVDLLSEGVDLAIRTGELQDSSLIARHLIQSDWVVCCAPGYLENSAELTHPSALSQHNCLVYTLQGKDANGWLFQHKQQTLEVQVSGNLSSNNSQALRLNALAGHGIVYLPKCCVYQDLVAKRLVTVLPTWQPRTLGVYAVYPYTKHVPRKLQLLVEHIKLAYQSYGHYFN